MQEKATLELNDPVIAVISLKTGKSFTQEYLSAFRILESATQSRAA